MCLSASGSPDAHPPRCSSPTQLGDTGVWRLGETAGSGEHESTSLPPSAPAQPTLLSPPVSPPPFLSASLSSAPSSSSPVPLSGGERSADYGHAKKRQDPEPCPFSSLSHAPRPPLSPHSLADVGRREPPAGYLAILPYASLQGHLPILCCSLRRYRLPTQTRRPSPRHPPLRPRRVDSGALHLARQPHPEVEIVRCCLLWSAV